MDMAEERFKTAIEVIRALDLAHRDGRPVLLGEIYTWADVSEERGRELFQNLGGDTKHYEEEFDGANVKKDDPLICHEPDIRKRPDYTDSRTTDDTDFEDLLQLFIRLADDPSKATREEKNKILLHPPPEEEDAIVRGLTDYSTLHDLTQKCLISGAYSLTDEELHLLTSGTKDKKSTLQAFSKFQASQSTEIQDMINQVYKNIRSKDEMKAFSTAVKEQHNRQDAKRREQDRLISERMRALRRLIKQEGSAAKYSPFANSVEKHVSEDIQRYAIKTQLRPSDHVEKWGFVVFRTGYGDDGAWEKYKTRMDELARKQLERYLVPEDIQEGFMFFYVEDAEKLQDLDREGLTSYLHRLVYRDSTPWGLSKRFFFTADHQVMITAAQGIPDPTLILHDGEVVEVQGAGKDVFPGYVTVGIIWFFMNTLSSIERDCNYLQKSFEFGVKMMRDR